MNIIEKLEQHIKEMGYTEKIDTKNGVIFRNPKNGFCFGYFISTFMEMSLEGMERTLEENMNVNV